MKFKLAVGTGIAAALITAIALAHAFPTHAEPGAGQQLATAPKTVSIWFDDKIEPVLSTLVVKNTKGIVVSMGHAQVSAKDPTQLSIVLKPLTAGKYHVYWRAVARDGHLTKGDYIFTVRKLTH